jgi:hypothetical protein
MVISDQKKFICLHVPRTGGISMGRALRPWSGASNLDVSNLCWELDYPHYTAMEVLPLVGADRFHRYFKFAFVRNPWERMVSRYFYLKRQRAEPGKPLNRRGYFHPGDRSFADWMTGQEQGCVHPLDLRPQLAWLANEAGEVCMDFVGRYEQLATDFNDVCARLGLRASLPHDNRSEHGGYRDYYDVATRDFVAELFRRDIELWGYDF